MRGSSKFGDGGRVVRRGEIGRVDFFEVELIGVGRGGFGVSRRLFCSYILYGELVGLGWGFFYRWVVFLLF